VNKTIAQWQKEIHDYAIEKGWWRTTFVTSSVVITKLALIHSEISEALEELRNDKIALYYSENKKPEGFEVELADAVIRIFDLAAAMSIDLERIIEIKHEYNKTRPYKHGGKIF